MLGVPPMRLPVAFVLSLALVGCGAGESATVAPTPDAAADVVVDVAEAADAGVALVDVPSVPDVPVVDDVGPPPPGDGYDPLPPGEAVSAPANQWTWVDVPGSRCANGTPTGFAINRASDDSSRVLIFLQGGGACWDGATCLGPVSTSFYVATGYGRNEFTLDVLRVPMLPLQRANPLNPFRGMNLVYVPYCTGDVHGGERVARYSFLGRTQDFHHMGARNLRLILSRLVSTFPGARRVWLAGVSAGGFGASLNMERAQRAFPNARVDVIDDSGQPVQPAGTRWSDWRVAWGMRLPAGCVGCETEVAAMADYLRTRYPDNRFGLISYTHDSVISTFMGLDAFTFNSRLTAFTRTMITQWTSGRAYLIPGALHVGLATAGPGLSQWLTQMVNDDPAWRTVN